MWDMCDVLVTSRPRSKLNDINSTVLVDEGVGYYPTSDYKRNKNRREMT